MNNLSKAAMFSAAFISLIGSQAFGRQHIDATHCEIFIDRIGISRSSHGSVTAHFFIKTVNARLDAPITEVGARTKRTTTTWQFSSRTCL